MHEKTISREYRIYLALWRKAVTFPDAVIIKASSYGMAVAMRQGMYRAIRPFRSGMMEDNQLRTAAEKFVVYLDKGDDPKTEHQLILKARASLAELELSLDFLGIDEEDLLLSEERDLQVKLEKFVQPDALPSRSTAFYTRDN